MKTITILAFAVLLSGCNPTVLFKKPEPFNAHCHDSCFAKCDDPMVPITADPDSAIVSKKVEHIYRQSCDVRRDLCSQCIRRAQDAGAISK